MAAVPFQPQGVQPIIHTLIEAVEEAMAVKLDDIQTRLKVLDARTLNLYDDIGMDSLDTLEIALTLEQRLGIDQNLYDYNEIKTLGDFEKQTIELMKKVEYAK